MKVASLFMLLFALTIGLTTRAASGPTEDHARAVSSFSSDAVETPRELQLHDSQVADLICGNHFHWCSCNNGCSGCAPSPSPCDGFCRC